MASRRTAFDTVLTPDSFMVAPETSGPSLSNLRGSKRGACDRCRGQKLRCMREDQTQDSVQATCARCVKAGATCSFRIPSKRTGRPPASHGLSSQARKPHDGGAPSRATLETNGLNGFSDHQPPDRGQKQCRMGERSSGQRSGENATDQDSEADTEDLGLVHTMSPWSLNGTSNMFGGVGFDLPAFSESSTATLPWPDEAMPSFYNDAGEFPGFESFGAKWSRAFNTYEAQSMDIQTPTASPFSKDNLSRNMSVLTSGAPAQNYLANAQISGLSNEAMDLDLPHENVYASQFTPTNSQKPPLGLIEEEECKERAQEYANLDMSSTAKSPLFENFVEKEAGVYLDEETLSVNENRQRRMQELSELAMDLYTQLAANDRQKHQPTSGATATNFQDQLVGGVLKSSNTFLTLLGSLGAPTTPSSPDRTFFTNHNISSCNSSDSDSDSDSSASSIASVLHPGDPAIEDESVPEQEQRRRRNPPIGNSADLSSNPYPPIEMTTVLQLLTCYMHIIHLHSIMHARLLDYMLAFLPNSPTNTNINTSNNSTQSLEISVPPVFPGMQVGGVSLDQFGTFQVKLLLQISMHLLGEIELALGLPKEYTVGKRKGTGRGVLEASVSGGFVKCLMQEEAWRGKRIECVRERLAYLRRVLRGAVDSS